MIPVVVGQQDWQVARGAGQRGSQADDSRSGVDDERLPGFIIRDLQPSCELGHARLLKVMGHNRGRDNVRKRMVRRKKTERLAAQKQQPSREATARQGKKTAKRKPRE